MTRAPAASDGEFVDLSSPPVRIAVRRSARARRLTLKICNAERKVTLTAPHAAPISDIRQFAMRHCGWIESRLSEIPERVQIRPGATIPLAGVPHAIRLGDTGSRAPKVEEGEIVAPTRAADPSTALAVWLREEARSRLTASASVYAEMLGLSYSSITIRDTRSRWGSCSSRRALSFSWRMILAPGHVLDYLAAHEVAHLAEMNHSSRFWKVLEGISPDYRRGRDWLRREGAGLHRYSFATGA